MERTFIILAAAIGLAAGAWTGNALALQPNEADPEGAFINTWVGHGAVDTGALPDASGVSSKPTNIASGSDGFHVVEIGGVRFRVGLDTGP